MKLLVFAHTPPPNHGQSYMVQFMLQGFGGDHRKRGERSSSARYNVECYHVNAQFSRTVQDIGSVRPHKLVLLLGYCLQAIWCRLRYRVRTLYYIPAPGQRGALYRDWLVMLICRPFFKGIVFHWHAAGMTNWLETSVPKWGRWLTLRLMGKADLSIVLSEFNRLDGERLASQRVAIVCNGIPDPCPGFKQELLPRRLARFVARNSLSLARPVDAESLPPDGEAPHRVRILYLAHCTREKGLFDVLEAIALANSDLALSGSLLRFHLTVAGEFLTASERSEFESRCRRTDLQIPEIRGCGNPGSGRTSSAVEYMGFLSGDAKKRAFAESDCFCFPTFYHAENLPLVLIEAMAFGLPVITTRWRSIPELFPSGYSGLVDVHSPAQIAAAMRILSSTESGENLREIFLRQFTMEQHLSGLAKALTALEIRGEGGKQDFKGSHKDSLPAVRS